MPSQFLDGLDGRIIREGSLYQQQPLAAIEVISVELKKLRYGEERSQKGRYHVVKIAY